MPKFRKKPVVIEAFLLGDEYPDWFSDAVTANTVRTYSNGPHGAEPRGAIRHIEIQTLEGVMTAVPGEWIIKGVNGEIYPCKPDIFEKSYEPA
jgi:hypothetical protein